MNEITQFLRLFRLVLLVVLLLIAVAAKIARAESAWLYTNHYGDFVYGSPAEACAAIPGQPGGLAGPEIKGSVNSSGNCYATEQHKQVQAATGAFRGRLKTCDAKELTNPNPPFGYESLKDLFIFKAPQGDDAALWFPDKFSSCENNCVVRNTRYYIKGKDGVPKASVTEADGSSRSVFYKRQTGEVCVPEKPKKNDPPKPPAPDNNNGGSQGNSGSDNGQGNQSNESGGESSSGGTGSGSASTPNQGSGNSNEGGSNGGGSGGGSGGVNGSGGHTGPSGGGAGGGEDSGSEGSGSEGEAGGESDGSGEESGGSGDSGGESGGEGSGQGNVGGTEGGDNGQSGGDGDGEAGGHYISCPSGKGSYKKGTQPSAECLGEGKGEGSIGGGSCDTDTPPDCKGDPVQCYIAREQWRTACAASGKSNKIEAEGNCLEQKPPQCKGDALQCYIAKQQWQQGCAAAAAQGLYDELGQYGNSQKGYLDELQKEGNPEGLLRDIKPDKIDLSGQLKTNLINLSGACPSFPSLDLGVFGTHQIPTDNLCEMLRSFGRILLALSYVFAFGIIVRAT